MTKKRPVEQGILDALRQVEHMSAPNLARTIYDVDEPTPAQRSAVRRALAVLQRNGQVVKLGNLFHGERCSYAVPETALAVLRRLVEGLGPEILAIDKRLARFFAERGSLAFVGGLGWLDIAARLGCI